MYNVLNTALVMISHVIIASYVMYSTCSFELGTLKLYIIELLITCPNIMYKFNLHIIVLIIGGCKVPALAL